jgi:hypothetical protein
MFRFAIRDVLWLMVVVGILCAWWLDRRPKAGERMVLRTNDIYVDGKGPVLEITEERRWIVPKWSREGQMAEAKRGRVR